VHKKNNLWERSRGWFENERISAANNRTAVNGRACQQGGSGAIHKTKLISVYAPIKPSE